MKSYKFALTAVAVLLLASAIPLSAQENLQELLDQRGIALLSTDKADGKTVYSFSAQSGTKFSVESDGEISVASARSAFRLLDTLLPWKSLTPGTQQFRIEGNLVTLRLVPGKLVSGARDLKPFVPSGLSFSIDGDRVEYDFRIKSGAYFLRLAGRLQTEALFLDRLVRAIDNPAAYARDNDPDYLARQLAELGEALEAEKTARAASEAKAAALEARSAEQEKALGAVQAAAMAAHAKGAFGAPKPIPAEVVDGVRKAKAAKPNATAAEVAASLKNDKVAATDRQIKAVLAVLYGE
jgi:hypothetical protein